MGKGVVVALSALWFAAAPAAAQDAPRASVIASYPTPSFLENLSVGSDGQVLFTSYLDRSVLRWSGAGAPDRLTQLDTHPVAILSRRDDIVLTAHGKPFTEGPAFTATNEFLVLGRDGGVRRRTPAPDALFLNGLVELSPMRLLAADAAAGRIWSYDPATGSIAAWLADPLLTVDPAQAQRPGANGLKLREGFLYISNSSRGALFRLPVADGKPAGALETVATPGPIDDFAFLSDGSIAAATHGAKLIRIMPGGAVSEIMATGCDGCTSVAVHGADQSLLVLTTGNLLEGGKEPARLLRLPSPVSR